MLFLDGAYLVDTSPPMFRRIGAPSAAELGALLARIAERIGRALERTGWLVRDCETSYLALDPASSGPMDDLIGHSIAYRVAMGPRAGQKAFSLQTVPPQLGEEEGEGVARAAGFSLHAGIGIEAQARGKLERLCRYVSRPAVAEERLVLVPPPRMHLTRYHGVFAPELGATAQARVRDRHRELPALRREAAGDREHRGPGAHRADSGAPRAAPGGGPAAFAVCPACTAAAVAALLIIVRWSSECALTAGRSSEALHRRARAPPFLGRTARNDST
jgi:hypothetical protein